MYYRTMSYQMVPKHISLLSPGIDESSSLYKSTTIVTPEKLNLPKIKVPSIRKKRKHYYGFTCSRNSGYDSQHEGYNSTVSYESHNKTVTDKNEDKNYHLLMLSNKMQIR